MTRPRTWVATLALLGELGLCLPAFAAPAPADPAAIEEALDRFRRGVTLYEEGDIAGALAELQRAYQIAPNYKILYNLGQIAYQSRDYATALGYFRRYLIEGGDQVPDTRRREVEGEIRTLKKRAGHLDIQVQDAGSAISVDDVSEGVSPLPAPVVANVGRHRVEVISASGQHRSRVVDVAGGETISVRFESEISVPPPALAPAAPSLLATEGLGTSARASSDGDSSQSHHARSGTWLAWTATAVLAVGAGVTGGLALQRSHEAQDALSTFPVSKTSLDDIRGEQHTFALVSDGLMIGTLVMAGVSLYLSFSGSGASSETAGSARASHLAKTEP